MWKKKLNILVLKGCVQSISSIIHLLRGLVNLMTSLPQDSHSLEMTFIQFQSTVSPTGALFYKHRWSHLYLQVTGQCSREGWRRVWNHVQTPSLSELSSVPRLLCRPVSMCHGLRIGEQSLRKGDPNAKTGSQPGFCSQFQLASGNSPLPCWPARGPSEERLSGEWRRWDVCSEDALESHLMIQVDSNDLTPFSWSVSWVSGISPCLESSDHFTLWQKGSSI